MGIFDAIKPRKQMTSMFITDVDKEYCRKNGLKLTAVFHMGVEAHRQGNDTLLTKVQRMAELLQEQSRRIYTLEHEAKQRGDE